MPIYEYQCKKCGVVEIMQKISEGTKRKCPDCGAAGLKKLVSAPAFQLKGSGWYVTDFRDGDKAKKDDAKADKKDDSKADKKDDSKASESTTADSKPADKSTTKADSKTESTTKKGGKDKVA